MPLPSFTVFDIETTGLDPDRGHRIVEIAGVRVVDGAIQREQIFCSYVNPERPIPVETRQIHKISDATVANAPTIMTVLPQFLDFASGSCLIAHNAEFDMGFLEVEKEFCWGYVELPECLCTMRLAQSVLPPHATRMSLDALCKEFAIAIPPERHRALPDVLLTAEVLLKLLNRGNIRSIDELRAKAAIKQLVS